MGHVATGLFEAHIRCQADQSAVGAGIFEDVSEPDGARNTAFPVYALLGLVITCRVFSPRAVRLKRAHADALHIDCEGRLCIASQIPVAQLAEIEQGSPERE